MYAFVFPGQGSQTVGMGKELYENFPIAREVFEEVNDALEENLSATIFAGPEADLNLTENSQPSLMAVSMAALRVLEKEGREKAWEDVIYVAGHSLGEYTALTAAGSITITNSARLLKVRGNAMQRSSATGEGALVAVIGLDIDTVATIVDGIAGPRVCVIANDNAPGQVVVSGHKQAIEQVMELTKKAGCKRNVLLPVSVPAHCSLMEPAAKIMNEALHQVAIKKPKIPLISNFTAEEETEPPKITQNLVTQMTNRVRWRESIANLEAKGVTDIVEIGAGKILTGLIKRICPSMRTYAINTPNDIETFLKQK